MSPDKLARQVKDKVVLVTGAGRGIGKRLALGFASAGARVGLLARSKAELDLVDLEIKHAGGVALRLRADVRDYEGMCAAVDRLRVHFGRVQVLVSCAAIQGPIGPLAESAAKSWAETIDINLVGAFHAARAVLPQMIEHRSGKIVVLCGAGAANPRPNFTPYAASQAGLVRLVESLAEEVRDHNVQVNCLAPGGTYTSMTDEVLRAGERAGDRDREDAVRLRLTGGMPPERQVQWAMFLAGDSSNHVSGKLLQASDDWRRLDRTNMAPDLYTLRRVQKV